MTSFPDNQIAAASSRRGWSGIALTMSGAGAAFAAAACCGLPIVLGAAGVGTAWLFGLARIAAPHRTALLIAATLLLAAGAVIGWRQSKRSCAGGNWCSRRSVGVATSAGLVLGLLFLALGYAYG